MPVDDYGGGGGASESEQLHSFQARLAALQPALGDVRFPPGNPFPRTPESEEAFDRPGEAAAAPGDGGGGAELPGGDGGLAAAAAGDGVGGASAAGGCGEEALGGGKKVQIHRKFFFRDLCFMFLFEDSSRQDFAREEVDLYGFPPPRHRSSTTSWSPHTRPHSWRTTRSWSSTLRPHSWRRWRTTTRGSRRQ